MYHINLSLLVCRLYDDGYIGHKNNLLLVSSSSGQLSPHLQSESNLLSILTAMFYSHPLCTYT